jgi:hypothetical protein
LPDRIHLHGTVIINNISDFNDDGKNIHKVSNS